MGRANKDHIPCPLCGGPTFKALFMALPLRMCADPGCCCAWGPATWLMRWYAPEGDGWGLYTYDGPYLVALWRWLRGDRWEGEDDDHGTD